MAEIERKWTKERHEAARVMLRTIQPWEHDSLAEELDAALDEIDRCWTILEARAGLVTEERKEEARKAYQDTLLFVNESNTRERYALGCLWAELERGWTEIEWLAAERDAAKAEVERLKGSCIDMNGERNTYERAARRRTEEIRTAQARLAHAHDAANALYQAALDVIKPPGETEHGWLCTHRQIEALRSALDPDLAAAALREVQRRDQLDMEVLTLRQSLSALRSAPGTASISDLDQAVSRLASGEWTGTVIDLVIAAWKGRPVLTEEAARAWAVRLAHEIGAEDHRVEHISIALQQAAHLQGPTAEQAPTVEIKPNPWEK